MPQKRKYLGTDKYGKPWYVFIRRSKDTISFFVFSEKCQDNDIPWEHQFVIKAIVSKISKNRAIIEEFVHTYSEETRGLSDQATVINGSSDTKLENDSHDDFYEQLCTEEPDRGIALPEGNYWPSPTEVEARLELDDPNEITNWENRGIGKLLLGRVESWASRSHVRALYGFLSPVDDIEKLKKMYSKWGWRVRIFSKNKSIIHGYPYAKGIIIKRLVTNFPQSQHLRQNPK